MTVRVPLLPKEYAPVSTCPLNAIFTLTLNPEARRSGVVRSVGIVLKPGVVSDDQVIADADIGGDYAVGVGLQHHFV